MSGVDVVATLDEIGALCRALRVGGPDPMDLQELSDALSKAVDLAHAVLPVVAELITAARELSADAQHITDLQLLSKANPLVQSMLKVDAALLACGGAP